MVSGCPDFSIGYLQVCMGRIAGVDAYLNPRTEYGVSSLRLSLSLSRSLEAMPTGSGMRSGYEWGSSVGCGCADVEALRRRIRTKRWNSKNMYECGAGMGRTVLSARWSGR